MLCVLYPAQAKIDTLELRLDPMSARLCLYVRSDCSVGKITSNLSPVASGPKPSGDEWVGEGGGVTLADSRISPVSGQATCSHWFCPFKDQINLLLHGLKVKWRNGQREAADRLDQAAAAATECKSDAFV